MSLNKNAKDRTKNEYKWIPKYEVFILYLYFLVWKRQVARAKNRPPYKMLINDQSKSRIRNGCEWNFHQSHKTNNVNFKANFLVEFIFKNFSS
jgi:glutathione peroxidase-family protein